MDDPYIARIGLQIQCKLCQTVHASQNSYLVHAQGKKHRAAVEARRPPPKRARPRAGASAIAPKKFPKIGVPAYEVTKVRRGAAVGILVNMKLPQLLPKTTPRWRLMSSFEQSVEPPDAGRQYLVIAAEPYDSGAIALPTNRALVSDWEYWDSDSAKALSTVLEQHQACYDDPESRHPLQYGPDEGSLAARQAFAEFANRTLNGTCQADCINLTNGASYGAASALVQLTGASTRKAFIVSPTYFLINNVFSDAGFDGRMVAIPESTLVESLEAELVADFEAVGKSSCEPESSMEYTYVLYLVPTFSNPGGKTLTLEQRTQILELARKYRVLLLCDEVYEWLDFTGAAHPPTLVTLDRQTLPEGSLGNVVANFSMSKVLGPGLRVGWQECATAKLAHHLSQSGAIQSGGTPAHLCTYAVADLMRSGQVDEVLETLNETYKDRSAAYRKVIDAKFPPNTEVSGGDGGYFFWVTLPKGYNVSEITRRCKESGIIVAPGNHFEVRGDPKGWGERCFRISLSYYDNEQALPALEKWAKIIAKCKA